MSSNLYVFQTQDFGDILFAADDIAAARSEAKSRFGLCPGSVHRWQRSQPFCERCDSRPCCCKVTPQPCNH